MNSKKARKKLRSHQHVMESESYRILESVIPKEWVMRPFNNPDYGIDVVIELFESKNKVDYEVLGEYLYVQVKSEDTVDVKKQKVYSVSNVAKGEWKEDRSQYAEIEVIKYVLDTNTILTVQESGAGVSVMLFVVDLSTKDVYFVCLNDYIDKIILPANPGYVNQADFTVTIPVWNKLSNTQVALNALKLYGKRAKLLAAFSKIQYQKNEIGYAFKQKFDPVMTYRDQIEAGGSLTHSELRTMVLYFISQLEYLDIWKLEMWTVLPEAKKEIDKLKSEISHSKNVELLKDRIIVLWHQLSNISTMYEDLCREWYLPKLISLLTSYPEPPEVIQKGE